MVLLVAPHQVRDVDVANCNRVEVHHSLLVFSVFRGFGSINFLSLEVILDKVLGVSRNRIHCDLEATGCFERHLARSCPSF